MECSKMKTLYPFSVADTESTRKLIRIARLAPSPILLIGDDGQELLVAISPEVFERLMLGCHKSKVL